MTSTFGSSSVPFLDMAANQGLMSEQIAQALVPVFDHYGVALDKFVVENVSLPEELQKALDTRISMGMVGDLAKYTQYQVASSVPLAAQNEGGIAGIGAGLSAGLAMGQTMAESLKAAQSAPPAPAAPAVPAEDPSARLGQLKGLLDKGLISQSDYDSAKTEILKKRVG